MGLALKEQGRLEESLEAYNNALSIKPDFAEAYINMGNAFKRLRFTQHNPDLQMAINSLLNRKTSVRPSDISQAALSLLKLEPSLQNLFQTQLTSGQLTQPLLQIISDLSELPLLLTLMNVCPLADLEFENLLIGIRTSLLLNISELKVSAEVLSFQSALASQCFVNEYIYEQSYKETQALQTLEDAVNRTLLNNEQPTPQAILCLASYKALHEYEWFNLLTITSSTESVFLQQILEPNKEALLKLDIPVLGEIMNDVSSKVREQYETNPYPRWINVGLCFAPASISNLVQELKLEISDTAVSQVNAPDVLIAGSGTGQHAIGTASRLKNSKVLAIDLSLSSLAYAKRKTDELNIQNLDYMQADILDLGRLNRRFDIIESSGVLHHMEDPMAGWQALTDCLKSGGLMKIGLYSNLARQHIVQMREEIKQSDIGSSDLAMKSFRRVVIEANKEHHIGILGSTDFYSLSTLRDLLFHVQEHRFDLGQIQDCLSALGLKFCGFNTQDIVQEFRLKNDNPYDLEKWQTYEEANPRVFAGMYEFWCQKIV
jgi:SAM-dependent methyltransferase